MGEPERAPVPPHLDGGHHPVAGVGHTERQVGDGDERNDHGRFPSGSSAAGHGPDLAHELADRGVLAHARGQGAVVAGPLGLPGRAGQGEGEGGPGPLGAADGDVPAHRLHQGPHDVEADPGAAEFVAAGASGSSGDMLGLPERFEAPGRLVGRHPDAVVGHADPHEPLVGGGAHHHRPVAGRVLDRVGQQMVEDLAGRRRRRRRPCGQRGRHLDDDRGCGGRPDRLHPLGDQRREVDRAPVPAAPTAWRPSIPPAPREPAARSTGSPGPGRSAAPAARSAAPRSPPLRR